METGACDDCHPDHRYTLGLDELWRFVTALQTTIETQQLIEVLAREVTRYVACDGVRFQNLDVGIDIQHGVRTRHRCNLRLLVDDELVGELSFHRSSRFSVQEIGFLECLSSFTQHPLRNSVLYFRASIEARSDALTSLGNRTAFDEFVARACNDSGFGVFSVVLFDIDFFKTINDQWGHQFGDRVLRMFSRTLQNNMRKSDGLFRYGGEEFAAVLPRTRIEEAEALAERIRSSLPPVALTNGAEDLRFTVSAGVAVSRPGDNPETIFRRADQALYLGKRSGRDRVVVFSLAGATEGI
jgi:diguanylate cyclase (GGDEF)-like protein